VRKKKERQKTKKKTSEQKWPRDEGKVGEGKRGWSGEITRISERLGYPRREENKTLLMMEKKLANFRRTCRTQKEGKKD